MELLSFKFLRHTRCDKLALAQEWAAPKVVFPGGNGQPRERPTLQRIKDYWRGTWTGNIREN